MQRQIPEGTKVKFSHGRLIESDWGEWHRKKDGWGRWDPEHTTDGYRTHTSQEISPYGGRTTCGITFADGSVVYGVAECSRRDNYCKKIGRDIALGRALKTAESKFPELFKAKETA